MELFRKEKIKTALPWLLIGLFALAHLVYFSSHLFFLEDQARHLFVLRDLVYKGHFPTAGPAASVGDAVYHGAWYYYSLLPAALTGTLTPISLTIWVTVLGIASAPLFFFGLKKFYGWKAAMVALFVYITSATIIWYTRWIWNPNLIPFYLSLAVFSLGHVPEKKRWALPLFFFAMAAVSQMHMSGFFILPVAVLMVPFLLRYYPGEKKIWLYTALAFLLPLLPTLIHEVGYGFPLVHGLAAEKVSHSLKTARVYLGFILGSTILLPKLVTYLGILIGSGFALYKRTLLTPFLGFSALVCLYLYSGYSGEMYIHYGEQFFVLIPLVLGIAAAALFTLPRAALWVPVVCVLLAVPLSINNWKQFNQQVTDGTQTYQVSKAICAHAQQTGLRRIVLTNVLTEQNPANLALICGDRGFSLQDTGPALYVQTNWKDTTTYRTQ